MKFKHIDIDLADDYFPVLALDCPEVSNAFDDAVIDELRHALVYLNGLTDARALFLTGKGKHFSAGANLAWMQKMVHYDLESNFTDAKSLAMLMKELDNFPLPTIAIVNGAAFGGALGLIAACDLAVAHEGAQFCFSEVSLGLIPAVISPYVINAIGEKAARRYFLTAERFTAAQAKKINLINEVYTDSTRKNLIEQLKKIYSQNSPDAMKAAKTLIKTVSKNPIDQATIDETIAQIARIRVSAFGQEGLNAFLEKRKPKWAVAHNP